MARKDYRKNLLQKIDAEDELIEEASEKTEVVPRMKRNT